MILVLGSCDIRIVCFFYISYLILDSLYFKTVANIVQLSFDKCIMRKCILSIDPFLTRVHLVLMLDSSCDSHVTAIR